MMGNNATSLSREGQNLDETGGFCKKLGLCVVLDESPCFLYRVQSNTLIRGQDIKADMIDLVDHQSEDEEPYDKHENKINKSLPIEVFESDYRRCNKSRKETVYCIHLDRERFWKKYGKSRCVELLKKIGCSESHFLRCSQKDRYFFYAILNDTQAADLLWVDGISKLIRYGDIFFMC